MVGERNWVGLCLDRDDNAVTLVLYHVGNPRCAKWNPHPRANETISWTGGCAGGKLSGRGVFIWYGNGKEDSRYEGEMREGKYHGRGIETFLSGNRYEGGWREGKKHGRGIYTDGKGNRYEGEWRNNNWHGKGILTFADGARYEGDFREGKEYGRGIYLYADGARSFA